MNFSTSSTSILLDLFAAFKEPVSHFGWRMYSDVKNIFWHFPTPKRHRTLDLHLSV